MPDANPELLYKIVFTLLTDKKIFLIVSQVECGTQRKHSRKA